jgi:hypothetical protein
VQGCDRGRVAFDRPKLDSGCPDQTRDHGARFAPEDCAQSHPRTESSRHPSHPKPLATDVDVNLVAARRRHLDRDGQLLRGGHHREVGALRERVPGGVRRNS